MQKQQHNSNPSNIKKKNTSTVKKISSLSPPAPLAKRRRPSGSGHVTKQDVPRRQLLVPPPWGKTTIILYVTSAVSNQYDECPTDHCIECFKIL
jgi:hypothetical protein